MEPIVQLALEPVQHVVNIGVAGSLKGQARIKRALAAAANQQHWGAFIGNLVMHQLHKLFGVGGEIGVLVPRHIDRTGRAADIQRLDLHADVDQHSGWLRLQNIPGNGWQNVFHNPDIVRH